MDVKVKFKAGGSFVELPPQFSFSSENVYVAWKNEILGYSSKTGALFAEFKGIRDPIVGFGVHYCDSYECITACSSSGELITWKVVTFFKMLNKRLEEKDINSFHIVESEGEPKALISFKKDNRISFATFELSIRKSQKYGFTINAANYRVKVCSDKYFAVCQKTSLNIVRFNDLVQTYTFCIEPPRHFTCLECHPSEEIILTGDNTGRVVVWQNIFTSKPTRAVFHWHTLPVKCIAFSASGSYFYSGGDEAVLVRWQIENSFEKKFLPRLPSTIAKIAVSPNNKYIALSTNDNAVRIIDSGFNNVSLIQHLVIGGGFESGIIVDPRTKALIMNGNVGHIQFYSPNDNSLLYNVDVVGQNKVSNERSCNIENTQVSKIAISKNGLWMSTVEVRRDKEYTPELRMKFWNFDLQIQNFKLNTSVENPHEKEIHAIAFQPTGNFDELKLVSVGADMKFKVWYLSEFETVERKSQIWKCLGIGFYHNYPCKDLSFSIDGSLVAVSFSNIVTTWLPDSCHLKCSLSHPICKEEVTQVEFGNGKQCHLIVAASKSRLSVFNLLSLTLVWTVPVNVSILMADTVTANMAIITKDHMVYVFTPTSPEPEFSADKLLQKQGDICVAAFVPTKSSNDVRLQWWQRSTIFYINSNKELFCLGSEEEETSNPVHEMNVESIFSKTIPELEVNKDKNQEPLYHLYKKDVAQINFKKFLEAPVQTMIPMRFMCNGLLKSMILQKK